MHEHRDLCAIVGIGATEFSKRSGRTTLSMATEASAAAIADAGLTPADIDGTIRCDLDRVGSHDIAHALGLDNLAYWGTNTTGGAAPSAMIGQAIGAILSGQATAVLVFRSLNGRSGFRFGQGAPSTEPIGGDGSFEEFFVPNGLVAPGQVWAMIARRHMHEFGTTSEQLGHIALACREHANNNPAAQMHGRALTMDDYMASRTISSPLRLFDYCQETDGACAVVVTTTERARDLARPPALIRAVAQGGPPEGQPGPVQGALLRREITTLPSYWAARRLYQRAGLGPEDIDTAQFYDCFTPTVLVQLEDYGFAPRGEGGPFAASGAIRRGGSLPINTSGGNLSEGYLHGMNHIVEGVRQIRGTSTNQVDGAEVCLVTSGIPVLTSAMILRSDR